MSRNNIKAIQSGKPLPIAVAGVNTLVAMQMASGGSVNTTRVVSDVVCITLSVANESDWRIAA